MRHSTNKHLEMYVERHNLGVRTGKFERLFELLSLDAAIYFHGIPVGPFQGIEQIRSAFTEQPPTDELILLASGTDCNDADYAWKSAPRMAAGRIVISTQAEKIQRIDIFVT